MRKTIALLAIIFTFSISTAYSQDNVHLDRAIQEVVEYLDTRLPARSIVAVLNVKSDNQALSSYIISELINTIIDKGNLIPVDRENLDIIQAELAFHLSEDVSDESAQAIGKILGAQTIISGEISLINDRMYRLEIKAISVETAAIQGIVNKNIQIDKQTKTLSGYYENFPISIGGGIYLGGLFTEGTREEKGKQNMAALGPYVFDFTITETNSKSEFDIGGFLFCDLKYAQINVNLYSGFGNGRWSWNKDYHHNNQVIRAEKDNTTSNFSTLLLNIGVLGKYPFYFNNVTLFPVIGADYQLWLYHAEKGKRITGDLSRNNSIWLRVGGGIDYNLTRSLFIRGELLWGAKLPSVNESKDSFTHFSHSPTINIGIGYILNQR